MVARPLPEASKRDLVMIRVPYEGRSTGADMMKEALELARLWPEKLDLGAAPGVKKVHRKAGDYVIFTFRKKPDE